MPRISLDPPLSPRDGRGLRVLTIDRISTKNQDPKSNSDQHAMLQRWIEDRYDGTAEWARITGQGSGECIDRQQVRDAEDMVASGRYDVVIMEDLGRHLRRAQAVDFCEQCEDHATRLIAINDAIDTFKDWRLHAFFAAIKHEQSNKDTSERIKRTLRNRFLQGEVVQCTIFGYVKPTGTKSDKDLQKDPAAEPIYDEWFRRLESGATYSEVADWLHKLGVPTGPYCRTKKWDCKMVARITHNAILKGERQRNNRKSKRVNKSGKRISVKAGPEELLQRYCPHLTFIEPTRYDRVIRMLKERNAIYKPGRKSGHDLRTGRPKKRTIWPGQHIYCGICGGLYRYGGHGQNDHLLCRGAYEYRCWNAITVDGPKAAQKLSAAILKEIESLPGFDESLQRAVAEEYERSLSANLNMLETRARPPEKIHREIEHLLAYLRDGNRSTSVQLDLERLEAELSASLQYREELAQRPSSPPALPSIDELKQLARESMANQTDEPYEFCRLMQCLIPKIVVWPYRLCDGGTIVLRAKFSLNLVSLLPSIHRLGGVAEFLKRDLTVDLFDPPQRVAYLADIEAQKANKTLKAIAKELGITSTAAQNAAILGCKMTQLGLTDPYLPMSLPPDDFTKLRRQQHPRYAFKPFAEDEKT